MIEFAEVSLDEQIVVSLIRQLSLIHFLMLISIKDITKIDFFPEINSAKPSQHHFLKELHHEKNKTNCRFSDITI